MGANHMFKTGANHMPGMGANHTLMTGANHTLRTGANHTPMTGANHTFRTGANHRLRTSTSDTCTQDLANPEPPDYKPLPLIYVGGIEFSIHSSVKLRFVMSQQ